MSDSAADRAERIVGQLPAWSVRRAIAEIEREIEEAEREASKHMREKCAAKVKKMHGGLSSCAIHVLPLED